MAKPQSQSKCVILLFALSGVWASWAQAFPNSQKKAPANPHATQPAVPADGGRVSSTGRHVYIMHQGLDQVLGSYLFLVTNSTGAAKEATIPLMLPQGVTEFVPGEGVAKKEIKLAGDGNGTLQIAKTFPAGEQLVSINFTLPAKGGEARFTITPTDPISTIKLMTPTGTLGFAGDMGSFTLNKEVPFSKRVYDTVAVNAPKMNTPYTLSVTNVPEGRSEYWQLGIAIAAIMLGLMITAAITRLKSGSSDQTSSQVPA